MNLGVNNVRAVDGDSPLSLNKLPNPFGINCLNSGATGSSNTETVGPLQGYRSKFNIQTVKQNYYEQQQSAPSSRLLPHHHTSPPQLNRGEQPKKYGNNRTWDRSGRQPSFGGRGILNQAGTGAEPSFSCDVCERYFPTADKLDVHVAEHDKCCFDGCKFEAHTSIVQSHIETQHNSGLFQKIKHVETEEDIEKWRAERRKRYPTKANVELRQKAQEARQNRGERLTESNKRFGRSNERNERKSVHRTKPINKNKRPRKRPSGKKNATEKSEPNGELEAAEGKVEAFKGISTVESQIEDESIVEQQVPNALAALAMYSSDSEISEGEAMDACDEKSNTLETCDAQEQAPDKKQITIAKDPESILVEPSQNENQVESLGTDDAPTQPDHNFNTTPTPTVTQPAGDDSDDEGPEEQAIKYETDENTITIIEANQQATEKPTPKPSTNSNGDGPVAVPKKRKAVSLNDLSKRYRTQNSLLQKLLDKDIRHERNVLLQCVHYVVAENFFDKT